MALACELTSVRGDRGENYENTKKQIKKKYVGRVVISCYMRNSVNHRE
jgi:hypothetical protein